MGVALFRDHPNAMFPFSAMDFAQRQYVENVVATCMSQFQQRDSGSILNANVVMQMGGGCILYAEELHEAAAAAAGRGPCANNSGTKASAKQAGQKNLLMSPRDVFEALCDCIFSSKRYLFTSFHAIVLHTLI